MSQLLEEIAETLRRHDLRSLNTGREYKYCVDLIGIKGRKPLLTLKVEEDLSRCNRTSMNELKDIGDFLKTCCMVVSEKYRNVTLAPGVFYKRYGIFAVNVETLSALLRGETLPFIYASQGGIYAKLDSKKIREAREERNMSLGDLAYEIGVSRRAVYEYEHGRMDASLDVAAKLEETLGENVIMKVSLEDVRSLCQSPKGPSKSPRDAVLYRLKETLEKLGFVTRAFTRLPFQLASYKGDSEKIVVKRVNRPDLEQKDNELTLSIARISRAKAVFIADEGEEVEEQDYIIVKKDRVNERLVENLLKN